MRHIPGFCQGMAGIRTTQLSDKTPCSGKTPKEWEESGNEQEGTPGSLG
jgi:hypothetical protein